MKFVDQITFQTLNHIIDVCKILIEGTTADIVSLAMFFDTILVNIYCFGYINQNMDNLYDRFFVFHGNSFKNEHLKKVIFVSVKQLDTVIVMIFLWSMQYVKKDCGFFCRKGQ